MIKIKGRMEDQLNFKTSPDTHSYRCHHIRALKEHKLSPKPERITDAKKQAKKRPTSHYVVVIKTFSELLLIWLVIGNE